MHPVYILAFATLAAVLAFAFWNFASVRRHQKTGGKTSGLGGPSDPLSGATTEAIRDPEEMRRAMDRSPAAAPERRHAAERV
jgi:hypothetical protein